MKPTKEYLLENPNLLYFPENIRNEEFKLRKLTLKIFKNKTFAKSYDEIVEKTSKAFKEITESASQIDSIDKLTDTINIAGKQQKMIQDMGTNDFELQIVLPIPNELNDSTSHDFNIERGIFGALAQNSSAMQTLQEDIGAKLAAATGTQKYLANPQFFQNYNGTQPRDFQFTFNLIPNSKQEAVQILNLIRILKKYSSPETSNNFFYTQPRFFYFEFGNEMLTAMMNPLPCVLKQIDTNYSASGYVDTTLDGIPKYIQIVLSFAEVRALEFSDWSNV